jgi:hypothetical protein
MFAFLVQPETAPFTISLLLMLLLGAVEALGLGGSALDLDLDGGVVADGLAWLNVGRLPLLIILIVFLTSFGLSGLLLQQGALMLFGAPLPWFAAVPAAVAAGLPATRLLARGMARIMPRDETTAVEIDSLLGRRARIVIGTAMRGSPARAKVEDRFGQAHFVMVEPVDDAHYTADTLLLLTAREGTLFRAIEIEPDIFSTLRSAS